MQNFQSSRSRETKAFSFFLLLSLVLMIQPYRLFSQKIELNRRLIAAYGFSGDAKDISGNNNDGQIHGAVLTQDRNGNPNSAYFFDGDNDYIEIRPVSDVSSIKDFTISLWVNFLGWEIQPGLNETFLDQQYVFDGHTYSENVRSDFYSEGFTIQYLLKKDYSKYTINSVFYSTSKYFPEYLKAGENMLNGWHHIVFMRKGDTTYHFFDGKLLRSVVKSGDPMNMQHTWYVGTFSGNNPYYGRMNYNFYGMIDDILIYDRFLNQCELDALLSGDFVKQR